MTETASTRPKRELPNSSYITVCEAVCWLALGDALTAGDIAGSEPMRELTETDIDDIRGAGRRLVEACAGKSLTLIGRRVVSGQLGNPEEIPSHFFSAAVAIDFLSNAIVPDASVEFAVFEQNFKGLTRWEEVTAQTDALRDLTGGKRNGRTKTQCQIDAIVDAAKQRGFDPLAVPYGGKGQIKETCMGDRTLFAKNSFESAWKAARRQRVVQMRDHDKFVSSPSN